MGSFSFLHWALVAGVALLLFGRGRISESMGDFGKGIRAFRKGMSEDDAPPAPAPQLPPAADASVSGVSAIQPDPAAPPVERP